MATTLILVTCLIKYAVAAVGYRCAGRGETYAFGIMAFILSWPK